MKKINKKIDIQDYLKDITETEILSIEEVVQEYFSGSKKYNTPLEVQTSNKWKTPTGIKPEECYDFDDLVKRVEENPNEPFSVSDVWVSTSEIFIVRKFNRKPKVSACIRFLNFKEGLNWEALDTPSYYLAKNLNGEYCLVSTIGGHRGVMCILANGFGSQMPCRVTFKGTLDLGDVSKYAALVHHIDCNKRDNQNATARLNSGVEAEDEEFTTVLENLIECNLFANEHQLRPEKTKDFRYITSWMNFKSTLNSYGMKHTKYAVDKLIENTDDGEAIVSQAVETLACLRFNFEKELENVQSGEDVFDAFLSWWFNPNAGLKDQSELRAEGKVVQDTIATVHIFNKWSKANYDKRYAPILPVRLAEAFGDDIKIS